MKRFLLALLFALLSVSLVSAQDANLLAGCVESYDANVDYFPAKTTISHATGFEVEYFGNYKVVRTLTPYPGAMEPLEYVLVQCGTPAPEGYEGAQMVEVPVDSVVSLSTTQLPQLQSLGQLNSLVGMDSYSFLYTNTPDVQAMIDAGSLIDVNADSDINVEVLLDMGPDLVLANGFNPETDAHPLLIDAGVFTAINSDWLEPSLLGRAEWLKFIALFYNDEAEAQAIFDGIVSEYEAVAQVTRMIPADQRVSVLWNSYASFTESWTVPGAESWVGQLLSDAGANWILMDQVAGVQQDFAFETVYEAGFTAPIWVVNAFGVYSQADLLALDERFGEFAAFESGAVFNNTAVVNANGGNDYWERGVSNPQLLLQDLVAIFYPDLLPAYEVQFYQILQ